jgi:hypothetical protein
MPWQYRRKEQRTWEQKEHLCSHFNRKRRQAEYKHKSNGGFTLKKYLLLCHPGHNEVYFENSKDIVINELHALASMRGLKLHDVRYETVADVTYLAFEIIDKNDTNNLDLLSRSSAFYAMFGVEDESNEKLYPIKLNNGFLFPANNSKILKYSGKTNEQFTRLMINMALSACVTDVSVRGEAVTVLDPLMGKGTTLFEAVTMGYNSIGIDISKQYVKEVETFFIKYLETGKYKHKKSYENKHKLTKIMFSDTKERYDAKQTLSMQLIADDTASVREYIGSRSVDIIVCDLPYGVQHFTKSGVGQASGSRHSKGMVETAMPHWAECLKRGGTVALSFNEYTTKRADLTAILEHNNLTVLDGIYSGFSHRVDHAVIRDLIIAIKK